jgi:Flp pilus assembly protein TadG
MHSTRAEGAHHHGAPTRRQRGERGSSAVEFALVVPVLLLLVFGIINFGLVMAQKASLSNAARAGARYGTVNAYTASTHTCASVIDKVRATAPTIGIPDTIVGRRSIGVTVKLTKAADGSVTTPCSAASGVASSGSTLPCANAAGSPATPDTLTVEVSYTSRSLVAVPGVGKSFALGGASAFQCEYFK